MKILVTGGTGFIGSHIVRAYLDAGHEVAVLDKMIAADKNAAFFGGDIFDARFVNYVMQQFRPDVVSHHAAKISVADSMNDPAFDAQTNIVGGLNVLKAAIACGAKRFIFPSSAAVYGAPLQFPIEEDAATIPCSSYGVAKLAFENYLRIFSNKIITVVFRYANVYEMSSAGAGVYSRFYYALESGNLCTIYGNGNTTRDYVHVKDVAVANMAALTKGDFETMNISTCTETTTLQVFEQVKRALNKPDALPKFIPSSAGDVPRSILSNKHAKQILNWSPQQ